MRMALAMLLVAACGSPDKPRPAKPERAGTSGVDEPAPPPTAREAATPNLEGDAQLEISSARDEANRLYDKMDFEGALEKARSVLEKAPGDIRMLRIAVSAACLLGDSDKAKRYWLELPPHDQEQMTRRCQRFGITFSP